MFYLTFVIKIKTTLCAIKFILPYYQFYNQERQMLGIKIALFLKILLYQNLYFYCFNCNKNWNQNVIEITMSFSITNDKLGRHF